MARVVEHVVDDLERLAQGGAIARAASLGVGIGAGQHRADPRRCLEQGCGLALDHLHVARLRDRRVMHVEQLQDLALSNPVGGIRQDAHHAQAADADHHLERA